MSRIGSLQPMDVETPHGSVRVSSRYRTDFKSYRLRLYGPARGVQWLLPKRLVSANPSGMALAEISHPDRIITSIPALDQFRRELYERWKERLELGPDDPALVHLQANGAALPSAPSTFGGLVTQFLSVHRVHVRQETLKGYSMRLQRWLTMIPASTPLSGITSDMIRVAMQRLSSEMKAESVNAFFRALRVCLNYAVSSGFLRDPPHRNVKTLKAPRREARWWTAEEVASVLTAAAAPLTPGRVFSGDGGGETVGFLLMPPGVMEKLGRGEIGPAIREYLHGHEMPDRLFRPQWRSLAAEHAPRAMREALSQYAHAPAQKAMHLFVILNDLRRHLHDFFEVAPGIGLDLTLPFYDRRVLHSVLRLAPPLDPYLSHRLYHVVLQRAPQACVRVPWQSYPGRLPCPLPREGPPLKTQWQLNQEWSSRKTAVFCRSVLSEWRQGRLAADYLNVPLLAAAAWAHRLSLRNFAYWLRPALALSDAVRRSGTGSRGCA